MYVSYSEFQRLAVGLKIYSDSYSLIQELIALQNVINKIGIFQFKI